MGCERGGSRGDGGGARGRWRRWRGGSGGRGENDVRLNGVSPTDFSRSMASLVGQRSAKPRADQKLANPSNSKKPRACKERLLPNPPNSYEVGGHRPPLQEAWGV